MLKLATTIIVVEFETPRLQKDAEYRQQVIAGILNLLLTKYFSPRVAMTIISDLAMKLWQENPDIIKNDLEEEDFDGYIT